MRRGICLYPAVLLAILFFIHPAGAAPRVYRDRVEPHWFANQTKFWYRNALRDGRQEFVLVDAEKSVRRPAFDHTKLATALGQAMGKRVDAERLPIDGLDFEAVAGCVVIQAAGKPWAFDFSTGAMREHRGTDKPVGALQPIELSRRSRRSGDSTSIVFVNRTPSRVSIWWVDEQGQRRGYGEIDPGGRQEQHTYAGHVWLVTDRAGKPLNTFEAMRDRGTAIVDGAAPPRPATRPAEPRRQRGGSSPDGRWTIIGRDNNLFLKATGTGTETPLTRDGKSGDGYAPDRVWWSPDSKKLVAMRVEKAEVRKIHIVESSPRDQLQPKLRTLDYVKPGDPIDHPRPQLFHVDSARQVPVKEELFANPWSIGDVRWSADSSRFTLLYNQRGHQALRVVAVDAASGDARALIDERSDTFICYSGKFFCQWIDDREVLWMSERDGWNHLWLYDAASGTVKSQITRGPWVVQSVAHVDVEKRQIWFYAGGIRPGQDPYYKHFCRVNFDGSGLTVLTEGDGTHSVRWNPGDRYFIDSWSRVDRPPVSELRRSDDGGLACLLEEADGDEVMAGFGGRWPERFVAKGRDGATDIYGIIIFPRDFDPKKRYPVVENIYAGPQGFFTPKSFRAGYGEMQRLADMGMIVVQCDGMGTNGRSKEFHDVCWRNLKDGGLPDRVAWIKAAGAKHPQMDLSRVGIYGGSAGGQNALAALLLYGDFYKVAVADCGCHDNRMDKIWWNEQWMGWPVGREYEDNSNATHAARLSGKLMLVVGELDSNVDPASTMQVVNALQKADKDFDLLIVTGAGHGAAETPYGRRRRAEFLVRHLVGK